MKTLWSLPLALVFLLVGCGSSDSDTTDVSGGSGGSAGSGGAGQAGSAAGGAAGMSGSGPAGAGGAAEGGAGSGGDAGTGGSGGDAGTGGGQGGSAGTGGGQGGSAGTGGASGGGGVSGGGPTVCEAATTPPETPCGTLKWAVSPQLSRLRNHHTTHAIDTPAGPFLYVIGGFDGMKGSNAFVDRAPILADGSLGDFVADTPLPTTLGGHVSMVVGQSMVVAGGMTASGAVTAASFYAPRHDDGTIGAWTKNTFAMAHPRMHAGSFVVGDDVYVVGGFHNNDVWDDIQRATLQPDGTLANWQPAGTLPGPRSHFSITLLGGYVYLTGGLDKSALTDPPNLKTTLRGRLLDDGTLGEWTDLTPLPGGLATHAAFVHGGKLHVGGGIDDLPSQTRTIYSTPLGADHTFGEWTKDTKLPLGRSHVHQMPLLHEHVYSVAGSIDFNLDSTPQIAIGSFP
jgi:hypothetical protein